MRDKLLEKIELLRQKMVELGLECGLDHPDVLDYSQKIDQLHNALLELDKDKSRSVAKNPYYRFFVREGQANFA